MGGGCFRPSAREPLVTQVTDAATAPIGELGSRLEPVIQAASKSSTQSAAKLDNVLSCLAGAAPPEEVQAWFQDWLARVSPKSRIGLQALMKRTAAHVYDSKTAEVEEALSRAGERAGDFGHVCSLAENRLRLDREAHDGIASVALISGSIADFLEKKDGAAVVPAFDRLVLLFRRALLTDPAAGGSAAGRLERWRELRAETGLPAFESQLAILSPGAQASLLGLLLTESSPISQVVVRRDEAVLLDAATQLPENGSCVLSPYFESQTGTKTIRGKRVEGGEGHGPRKEFFIAVSSDSSRPPGNGQPPPLFGFHRTAGQHWFSAYVDELENGPREADQRTRLRCFGKVLALAVANHCKLSFILPVLFFRFLMKPPGASMGDPALDDILSLDASLHASLKKCLKMTPAKFKDLKKIEGHPEELTREDYVAQQVSSILCPDAMKEVHRGFWQLAGDPSIWRGVSPADLRQMVCPTYSVSDDINIRKTFEVVIEDEMKEEPAFVNAFWSVVDGLNKEEKRRFLLFVTGIEVPPEPGSEQLLIQLPFSAFSPEEHVAMLEKLPQAHTCSNLLELPNYPEALRETGTITEAQGTAALEKELKRLLGVKLRLAINETVGYELDAVETSAECNPMSPGSFESPPVAVFAPASVPSLVTAVTATGGTATSWPSIEAVPTPRHEKGGDRDLSPVASIADTRSPAPVLKPAGEDFGVFLDSLQHGVSPAPPPQNSRQGIDSLLEELDQVMAIE